MRLSAAEIESIKAAVATVFGRAAQVRLFGSRVHDHLKGGDIDLMVEHEPGAGGFHAESRLEWALQDALGERRIDILYHERGAALSPIEQIAIRDGVVL